jgi:hypothetical protein
MMRSVVISICVPLLIAQPGILAFCQRLAGCPVPGSRDGAARANGPWVGFDFVPLVGLGLGPDTSEREKQSVGRNAKRPRTLAETRRGRPTFNDKGWLNPPGLEFRGHPEEPWSRSLKCPRCS